MIGKLEDIKINYFDIVICLEVFEHLPYPKEVIKNIYKYLNPNGIVYESESFGAIELLRPTHLITNNKYVGKTMNLFEQVGFVYANRIAPRIYIFSKNKDDKANIKNYLIQKLKNFIVYHLFKFEFKININDLDNQYLKIKKELEYFGK